MVLKLTFFKMEQISTSFDKDQIKVHFRNNFIFKARNGQFLEEGTSLEAEMPTQISQA